MGKTNTQPKPPVKTTEQQLDEQAIRMVAHAVGWAVIRFLPFGKVKIWTGRRFRVFTFDELLTVAARGGRGV